MSHRFRSPGLNALHARHIGADPASVEQFERVASSARIAADILEIRTRYRLTQRELAARVGTKASVIARLESADYEGHSMDTLRRIAAAVGMRVEVRFVPIP